jgi:hypothetical protein
LRTENLEVEKADLKIVIIVFVTEVVNAGTAGMQEK